MAAVQLMPDATIDTNESGTRHRTAERMAIQTGFPVISVSASMSVISVYVDGTRYTVEDTQYLMARANQAIQTLESNSTICCIVSNVVLTSTMMDGGLQAGRHTIKTG